MAQQANTTTAVNQTFTTVQTGKGNETCLAKLTIAAWQIAYNALWNTAIFSESEKETALNFIAGFIGQDKSLKKGYMAFVQRVLLARQYVQTHPGTYIPVPSTWFNAINKKGFAGTAAWLAAVDVTRASLPFFKIHLKAFAEAVLETIESESPKDFHYWRSYFIDQQRQQLLNLYLSVMGAWKFRE